MLGIADADSAENDSGSRNCVVTALYCTVPAAPGPPALRDQHPIRVTPGSRLHAIYGAETILAGHYCNYGLNPAYVARFEAAGLRVTGAGDTGDVRAMEIREHRFYVITLFHPQLESSFARPSPFVMAFVDAARGFRASA